MPSFIPAHDNQPRQRAAGKSLFPMILFIGAWQDEVRMFFKHDPKPDDPKVNPDWQPPSDPLYQYLFQEALFGWVPVYFAAIPLSRLRRFVPSFRPEMTKNCDVIVAAI